MEKLSSLFVGVVDFFAALLPGAATIGVLLYVDPTPALTVRLVGGDTVALFALFVGAYIVGQMMNAAGGWVLDWIYDLFYDPEQGWFVVELAKGEKPAWAHPLARIVTGMIERTTRITADKTRIAALKDELDTIAPARSGNAYQGVRAYLGLTCPTAYEQLERLESEQKFFRTSTVAAITLACVFASWQLALVAAFLLTRYVTRRRKTIERAYLLFSLRGVEGPRA